MTDLPTELWIHILNLPQLSSCGGILRMVCREWRDILCNRRDCETWKSEMVRSIDILKFAATLPKPLPWNFSTCAHAVLGGHLEVLKWLRGVGDPTREKCPWDFQICTYAAANGDLEMLQWLRIKHRTPRYFWNTSTCAHAALGGHLKVLKWLRVEDSEEGGNDNREKCSWDELTCAFAAEGGHLEVLKWARGEDDGDISDREKCPWDHRTRQYATRNKHLKVLKWVKENGCPDYPDV
jgi:hypothetical protein